MTFSFYKGEVVKSDNTHITINIHPLAHILDILRLGIQQLRPFTVYPNHIMKRHPIPLQVITTRTRNDEPNKQMAKQKRPGETHSVTYVPGLSSLSDLSRSEAQRIRDTPTKLLKNFISRTFTFLLSALLILHASAPYNSVGTIITTSYRHLILGLYPQSSIAQHTFQRSPSSRSLIHSVFHIPFTSSISTISYFFTFSIMDVHV